VHERHPFTIWVMCVALSDNQTYHSTVSLEAPPHHLHPSLKCVGSDEMVCLQQTILFRPLHFSLLPKNYKLTLFIFNISISIIILLIFNFCSLPVYKLLFFFNFVIQFQFVIYYCFQFSPYFLISNFFSFALL
jgi:hypothetical protein